MEGKGTNKNEYGYERKPRDYRSTEVQVNTVYQQNSMKIEEVSSKRNCVDKTNSVQQI